MKFEFFHLRFEFIAREIIHFPAGKAANILRGATGLASRRLACLPDCTSADRCPVRSSCLYAQIFEPAASPNSGPSGFANSPRPFVFRANALNGVTIRPGQTFHFDLNVFSLMPETIEHLIRTFEAAALGGLGPAHGQAILRNVTGRDQPVSVDLTPRHDKPVHKLRIRFLSPTELKHGDHLASRPEFGILFARIRDRIATLSALYGKAPLEIDYREIGIRSAAIQMTRCDLEQVHIDRRSSRTGQTHSIGGFTGVAEYEGDLTEFLPWLEAAQYTGVGRQPVWGKGEVAVSTLANPRDLGFTSTPKTMARKFIDEDSM